MEVPLYQLRALSCEQSAQSILGEAFLIEGACCSFPEIELTTEDTEPTERTVKYFSVNSVPSVVKVYSLISKKLVQHY